MTGSDQETSEPREQQPKEEEIKEPVKEENERTDCNTAASGSEGKKPDLTEAAVPMPVPKIKVSY